VRVCCFTNRMLSGLYKTRKFQFERVTNCFMDEVYCLLPRPELVNSRVIFPYLTYSHQFCGAYAVIYMNFVCDKRTNLLNICY